jgi:orotate phosphoribosyltransferase
MDHHVPFKTTTPFISEVMRRTASGEFQTGDTIRFTFSNESQALLDFYAVARLLALCRVVQATLGSKVVIDLQEIGPDRFTRLALLRLPECFESEGAEVLRPISQLPLVTTPVRPTSGTYWRCLVPLTRVPLQPTADENQALTITGQILNQINASIESCLAPEELSAAGAAREIHKIVYGLMRELILNSILHSGSPELIIAVAIDREPLTSGRPHRPGIVFASGQDKFHVLVMDFGKGLLASVHEQLVSPQASSNDVLKRYQSLTPFKALSFFGIRQKESSLVNSVFHGNFVIRKGRKSEGLHDVGSKVEWFGGILNFRTGRTELEIRHEASHGYMRDIRSGANRAYYLPGVIAAGLLPSHGLRLLEAQQLRTLNLPDVSQENVRLERFTPPKAMFGGTTGTEVRRRCELYAREFGDKYVAIRREVRNPVILFVDLALCKTISISFIDTLIQELCKGVEASAGGSSFKLLSRAVFAHAPRNIIEALKARTCTSFLRLIDHVAVFLDEDDQVHFVGVPRMSTHLNDIDDALQAVVACSRIPESVFVDKWRFDEEMLQQLRRYFSDSPEDIFFIRIEANQRIYCSHAVVNALRKYRHQALTELTARTDAEGVTKAISNDYDLLRNAAALLLEKARLRPVNCVVGIAGNGDRLATSIQRALDSPKLFIFNVDAPHQNLPQLADGPAILVTNHLDSNARALLRTPQTVSDPSHEFKAILSLWKPKVDLPLDSSPPVFSLLNESSIKTGDFEPDAAPADAQVAERDELLFLPYHDVELSAEFWHNVSTLGIVSAREESRDRRPLIFFEHNERIIEHLRTRRFVEEFVAEFARDRLRLEIDVIMHPDHPVGSVLAQTIASVLPKAPWIIAIDQTQYGGKLEFSEEAFHQLRKEAKRRAITQQKERLNTVIVDDSVFTGSSLYSMIGFAESLGLKVSGLLVLLNRLPTEISNSLSALPYPFAYFYRLHMPALSQKHSPDHVLADWQKTVGSHHYSYFVQLWCQVLSACPMLNGCPSYLFGDHSEIDPYLPLKVDGDVFHDQNIHCPNPHEIKQIVDGLILHPDGNILSFETRLAVAFNFIGRLLPEPVFWLLLKRLVERACHTGNPGNEAHFVRKLLLIISVSPLAQNPRLRKELVKTFQFILEATFSHPQWLRFRRVIVDAFMGLALLQAPEVFGYCRNIAKLFPASCSTADALHALDYISGAYAWSCAVLQVVHKTTIPTSSIEVLSTSLSEPGSSEHLHFALIDALSTHLLEDSGARKALMIEEWPDQDQLLREMEKPGNEILDYLVGAPGYTFTLKSGLMLSKASTALLFARNAADKGFFLWAAESKQGQKAQDSLSRKHLKDDAFSQETMARMRQGVFLHSSNQQDLNTLNQFAAHRTHTHLLGAEIRSDESMRYYLLLGFADGIPWTARFANTAFYNLLRYSKTLDYVLPRIHREHITSVTAWNTLAQSLTPIHPIADRKAARERRAQLRYAMSSIDFVDLLRRAVEMPRQAPLRQGEILERINGIVANLRTKLAAASRDGHLKRVIPTTEGHWPITVNTKRADLRASNQICSLKTTILEFVLYECLCNALAYNRTFIAIDLSIETPPSAGNGLLKLTVTNDCQSSVPPQNTSGITACKTAAKAADGDFDSNAVADGREWKAELTLLVRCVPEKLALLLYEYI